MIEGILTFYSETGSEGGYWALQDQNEIKLVSPEYGVFGNSTVWDRENPARRGITADDCEVLKNGEWLPIPDPLQRDPDYFESSLYQGERHGNREADARLMDKYEFKILYIEEGWDKKWGKGNWHWEDDRKETAIAPDGTRFMSGGTPGTEPWRPYGVSQGELTKATVIWEDGKGENGEEEDGEEEKRGSDTLLVEQWSYEGLKILHTGDHLKIYGENDEENDEVVWEGEIRLKEHPLFTESASGMWIHADQEGIDREQWAGFFFKGLRATLTPAAT